MLIKLGEGGAIAKQGERGGGRGGCDGNKTR